MVRGIGRQRLEWSALGMILVALTGVAAGCGYNPAATPGRNTGANRAVRVAISEPRCTIAPGDFKGSTLVAYGIGELLTRTGRRFAEWWGGRAMGSIGSLSGIRIYLLVRSSLLRLAVG